jgi:hypothetical protein
MSERVHHGNCQKDECWSGEPSFRHQAWIAYPGRTTNYPVSKDFQAGWEAGRDWARAETTTSSVPGCMHMPRCDDRYECVERD